MIFLHHYLLLMCVVNGFPNGTLVFTMLLTEGLSSNEIYYRRLNLLLIE